MEKALTECALGMNLSGDILVLALILDFEVSVELDLRPLRNAGHCGVI